MDMGKSFGLNHLIPLAIIVVGAVFHSCKDDVFDPEKVKQTYQDKFPVKDIDPNMDWKMTRQIAVEISVYEDYGVDYTVEIYDANPFNPDTIPHLLAQGTANQDMAFCTTIDCPSIHSTLYVTRVDPQGRRLMKPVYISNDQLITSFGNKPATSRGLTRAVTTRSDVSLQTMVRPYTEKEIEDMLSKAEEYKGQDMDANLSKNTLFKITKEYEGGINHGGSPTPEAGTIKLIIAPEATWKVKSPQTINQGLEIIVAPRGKIELKSGGRWNPSLKFTNTSSLVVLGTAYQEHEDDDVEDTRGEISGKGWIEFSNGGTNYNSGKIDLDDDDNSGINNNGGTFFNYGEIDVDMLIGSSTGSLFVNHGDMEADKIGEENKTGPLIENSCKIDVDDDLTSNGIKMGPGARIKCEKLYAFGYIDLSANSMIKVEETSEFQNCNITGPTADKSYALLKLHRILKAQFEGEWKIECKNGYLINNVYCEYKEDKPDFANTYLNGKAGGKGSKGNGNAVMCKEGEAPKYIPAGRCTGEGNTPNEGGEDIPAKAINYTYAFEDNFPFVGDYDFNDIVLDVTMEYLREQKTNYIKATQINITLVAVGASKPLGAGLRIVDVNKSAISNIKYGGTGVKRFPATLPNSVMNTDIEHENEYLTIPLFGNAHAVFENIANGTIVNTGKTVAPKTYTYEIILEQSDQNSTQPLIGKDNLDFFICYKYKNMDKRMEVHLYEFWDYGATAAGTVQKTNLDLAGNNTWAICVPDFRYPKELINISNQKDDSDCAYPLFLNWARDRNQSPDWYEHPNENNVYR